MDVPFHNRSLDRVTVSIGIAILPTHGITPEELLRKADLALYAAKRGGRDQVCIADNNPAAEIRESGLA